MAATVHDIVVYGGTSGGVVAAVQAARCGKSVVLISPTKHVGGMTSSGLGWTDLGKPQILGGIAREFHEQVYLHYQQPEAWTREPRAKFGNAGQHGPAFDEKAKIASVFEPKVAEAVFVQLLADAKVEVVTGQLDLKQGITMQGHRIQKLRLENGSEFEATMFIDASYEGDLLPGAGVTFVTGREANATYGETCNGIQVAAAKKNQLPDGIDPYIRRGDAASGVLPGVESGEHGSDGSADDRLQAYCYRMVLTDDPQNRVTVEKPDHYQESDYELVFRAIDAGQTTNFFKLDRMPNHKTDSNNSFGISTDFIGMNYGPDFNWATASYEKRAELERRHEDWQRGLIWTLQHHPRVPEAIQKRYAKWGLAADEFTDHRNWPYQIYVREARRMVSDYVMSEKNCRGLAPVEDSIGLAAYGMDSHNVRRIVVNGMVKNEGDIQMAVKAPYGIAYRSIVPKAGECENLLEPWSLSATHVAFGSIRMEAVFMILSQSAGTAAALAIDAKVPVQQVPYPELRRQLLAAGMRLDPPK